MGVAKTFYFTTCYLMSSVLVSLVERPKQATSIYIMWRTLSPSWQSRSVCSEIDTQDYFALDVSWDLVLVIQSARKQQKQDFPCESHTHWDGTDMIDTSGAAICCIPPLSVLSELPARGNEFANRLTLARLS